MAAQSYTYIDTRGTAIVAVNKYRGRAPAQPGRFLVTDPAELRLLETVSNLRLLEYVASVVQQKDQSTIAAERQAAIEAQDLEWYRMERQAALTQAIADQLNALGASPPVTLGSVEADYQSNLATARAAAAARSRP